MRTVNARLVSRFAVLVLAGLAWMTVASRPSAQSAPAVTILADVVQPSGGVIQGSDGALYGTSRIGGPAGFNCGYVYRLDPQVNGTYAQSILYEFRGFSDGVTDGCRPGGELVAGPDGAFYGTTTAGGPYGTAFGGTGTIYKVTSNGEYEQLHKFADLTNGYYREGFSPVAGLVELDGNFYGMTNSGGTAGDFSPGPGTIFKWTPGTPGVLTVLHHFSSGTGQHPQDALTRGSDGNFYGTALASGPSNPAGLLFKITPEGVFSPLFAFPYDNCFPPECWPLGANPWASPTEVSGQFYVLGNDYGPGGYGTVVRVDSTLPPNQSGTLVHAFDGPTGRIPTGALVRGADGYFYGVTMAGGREDEGTIYRIAPDGSFFPAVHDFVLSEGAFPLSSLLEIAPGQFIGTLSNGPNGGAVYRFNFTPGNIAPVAVDGSATTPEDTPMTGQFSASDGNSDPLTFSIVTNAAYGTAVITDPATGAFSYTPYANLFGTDVIRFKASDGHVDSLTATFTIAIQPVNDAPVASNWSVSTSENTPVTSTVFANDIDSPSLTYAIVANGTKGTAEMLDAAAGLFRYTPNPGAVGNDSFTFLASDGSLSSNATVSVSIAAVNEAPVAHTGVVTTTEGTLVSGMLQATDPDGDALTFSVATPPAQGAVVVTDSSTGAFTYSPNPGAIGYDKFTYQVSDGSNSSTATEMVFIVASSPRWPGQTVRVSVDGSGAQVSVQSARNSISADGRYLAFDTTSATLVPGDTNNNYDVFVHDRQTGQIERVSVSTGGAQGNGGSLTPTVSADGRYVVFRSLASNLVLNDTNATWDVFVHDRETHETNRVSVSSSGAEVSGVINDLSLSADGRFVAFDSSAPDLVSDDTNNTSDVFVHDRSTGNTTRISASAGVQGNGQSIGPSLSLDGRFVAFSSYASNLVAGDTNGQPDVFVRDRLTGEVERVSVGNGGVQGASHSSGPVISADGRYVAFRSAAANLVNNDTNGVEDVLVRDRATGETTRVSIASGGPQGNGHSGIERPSLSADGRFVAFQSAASNLTSNDLNGVIDIFVHDRADGSLRRINVTSDGTETNAQSLRGSLSADGRFVSFDSMGSTLVPGDTNADFDVFAVGGVTVSPSSGAFTSAGGTGASSVSFVYPGTPWTAISQAPWITISDQSSTNGNGIVTYSVAPNTAGSPRTGTLTVALQTVTIQQDANGTPVASDGVLATNEDSSAIGSLTATDPDGDPLTYSISANGTLGVATITNAATGAYSYTPNPNASGSDTFTFRVTDGTTDSNIATMAVTISPVNDAPVASPASLTTAEDTAATGTLHAADVDGPTLTFLIATNGTRGTATITDPATGAYTYTPNPNASGGDTFTFQASDGSLVSDPATVSITITSVPDPRAVLSTAGLNFGGQRVGSSSAAPQYSVGSRPAFVASGDLNGDGHPDLVTANQLAHTVSVLVNNGNSTFSAAAHYPTAGTTPTALVVMDFSGDGRLDVVATNQGSRNISVLLGNGDGTLQSAVVYPSGQGATAGAFGIAASDLNSDGRLDLAVANSSGAINVLFGNGDGTFLPGGVFTAANAIDVASADFNNDGALDLATARQVLLGNGDGTFQPAVSVNVPQGEFLAVADYDGDGVLDVASAVRSTPGSVVIRLGNGDGTFRNGGSHEVGRAPFFMVAGDLNGDERADLAVASPLDSSVSVLLGNGDGSFQPVVNYGRDSITESVAMADVSGDEVLDLAVANAVGNSVSVLIGKGDGKFHSSLTVTVLNTGDAPLHVGQLVVTGVDASEFVVESETCPVALDPQGACAVFVGFRPASPGLKSATLQINSDAAGSPHEVTLTGFGLSAPIAQNGSITTPQGTTVNGQLAATDANGDPLTFAIVSNGTLGTAVITNASTGDFTYTPNPGASGADSFTFRASDGTLDSNVATVSVTIAASPLAVALVAPNGGERVFATVPTTIRWSASGAASVDVELSRNGGGSYTAIPGCTALAGGTTTCTWTPTGPGTSNARIRVTARPGSGAPVTDASDANFTISTATPTITVTTPNTAVLWTVGSTRTIQWNHNLGLGSFVRIELSRNAGGSWEIVAPSVQNAAAASGSFSWVIAGPETTAALVRVSWTDGSASDVSNTAFSIVAPVITVTTPNTAVSWQAGSSRTLRATHNLGTGQPIAFDVSRDNGTTWNTVGTINTTSATSAALGWVVSGPPTTQARIRARWVSTPTVFDVSDVSFTITPRVTVTAPNTAVTWGAGSTRTVTWTHSLGTAELVNIDVSVDNGATWSPLASGVANATATTGSLAVRLPAAVTTQALVRVSPVSYPADGDVSNVPFTLAAPSVTVTAPNSNVNWSIGSLRSINWSHNLGTLESVNIEVSRDGGNSWITLASGVRNSANASGTFSWTVTGPATTTARIRVTWTADGSVQDVGNVNFRIQ